MTKVTEETTLKEVLGIPGAEKVLSKYRMPCLGCPMAKVEMGILKIGDVCDSYGIDKEALLKELNELESSKDKKEE